MHAYSLSHRNEIDSGSSAEATDARMVGRMRLVLAVAAFLAMFIDAPGFRSVDGMAGLVFCGYIVHSLVVYAVSMYDRRFAQSRVIHWLDIVWYALIVVSTNGNQGLFFLFFFFAILTSSFRWGFEEGARVTVASTALFVACALATATQDDMARLLLRATFLLTLGYMCVHWGGSKVELKRRLALLRDVSRLSNPRFGVDQTIASVLEKTRAFFGASACILLLHDKETDTFTVRTVKPGEPAHSVGAQRIGPEMALPLMDARRGRVVAYRSPVVAALSLFGGSAVYDADKDSWTRDRGPAGERLAELLEAHSFISAPLHSRKGPGRIYVVSHGALRKSDALFLSQIGAQAFPVIDNIDLLDRMASDAASQERRKIALDIHDTAIQPYIGLKLGLSALRHKAEADNPLIDDLDRLASMAAKVIDDLRRYAGSVRQGQGTAEHMLLANLRRQAAQVREFYGIDVAVEAEGDISISDRLAAEVLQIAREGLNNICKHTLAQRGAIRLRCDEGSLAIEIENECGRLPCADFSPRSIMERANALGGSAAVVPGLGAVAVRVEIPI